MSKYDYELIRRAARPWICDRCGETIAKGERYIDRGWRNDSKKWIHIRKHINCFCKHINRCTKPEEYPIPVTLHDGTKEWFLGTVHDMEGRSVLLTHDWDTSGKYHFRFYVYDEYGNRMTAKNLSKS